MAVDHLITWIGNLRRNGPPVPRPGRNHLLEGRKRPAVIRVHGEISATIVIELNRPAKRLPLRSLIPLWFAEEQSPAPANHRAIVQLVDRTKPRREVVRVVLAARREERAERDIR